jgi:hypothetical protein
MRGFDPGSDDIWPGLPRLVDEAAAGLQAEGMMRISLYREISRPVRRR